jgi:NAD(P)-dependent dehydrogenase (short-subunit alcohol dehydrogenase family)
MASIFVTISSDALGRKTAQLLIEQGHRVVLHARNESRTFDALAAVPKAEGACAVVGDLTSITQTCSVADQDRLLDACKTISGICLPS